MKDHPELPFQPLAEAKYKANRTGHQNFQQVCLLFPRFVPSDFQSRSHQLSGADTRAFEQPVQEFRELEVSGYRI